MWFQEKYILETRDKDDSWEEVCVVRLAEGMSKSDELKTWGFSRRE